MADTKVYVPKQYVRRGVAGYRGGPNVVVVDKDGKPVKGAKKNITSRASGTSED